MATPVIAFPRRKLSTSLHFSQAESFHHAQCPGHVDFTQGIHTRAHARTTGECLQFIFTVAVLYKFSIENLWKTKTWPALQNIPPLIGEIWPWRGAPIANCRWEDEAVRKRTGLAILSLKYGKATKDELLMFWYALWGDLDWLDNYHLTTSHAITNMNSVSLLPKPGFRLAPP